MDLDEIKKIVELMDEHGLSQFKLEQDDTTLELKKGSLDVNAVPQYFAAPQPAPAPAGAVASAAGGDDAGSEIPDGEVEITSPMVGTFYRASSPETDSFASTGTEVDNESTVCIIEAMKVMNEIKADVRGQITKVLIENGTPVQYGEPLFRVKPAS